MSKTRKILIAILSILVITMIVLVRLQLTKDIDLSVYNSLHSFESDNLTIFFKIITNLGGTVCITLFTISTLILMKRKDTKHTIGNIGIAVLINQLLKNIFRRPRPTVIHLVNEKGFSFPSGHSMASMAFYGYLIYLLIKSNKNKIIKIIISLLLVLLILVIGTSRIYLGVHYFSDVLTGFLISLLHLTIYTYYVTERK